MSKNNITRDDAGHYTLRGKQSEEDLLHVAEEILRQRMVRAGPTLEDPSQTQRFLRMALAGELREVFAVLHLDNRHQVIGFEKMFYGTIASCEVHPREVVRRCIHHNTAAIILAHNHPSGNPEPSGSDRVITQRLKEALALIDVRVLDHFVVSMDGTTSMALRGWV